MIYREPDAQSPHQILDSARHRKSHQGRLHSRPARIRGEGDCAGAVCVHREGGEVLRLENDFVFALTGYHPDFRFLRDIGVEIDPVTQRPQCDPETLESNVPGIYLAGVIIAGRDTNEIFIENGRFHGKQILSDIVKKL